MPPRRPVGKNSEEHYQPSYGRNLNVQAQDIPASELLRPAAIVEAVDRKLRTADALAFLLSRLPEAARTPWQASTVQLGATTLAIPYDRYDTRIALTAVQLTDAGEVEETGLCTIVGQRVYGDPKRLELIDCSRDLAFAVNAMAMWCDTYK